MEGSRKFIVLNLEDLASIFKLYLFPSKNYLATIFLKSKNFGASRLVN